MVNCHKVVYLRQKKPRNDTRLFMKMIIGISTNDCVDRHPGCHRRFFEIRLHGFHGV